MIKYKANPENLRFFIEYSIEFAKNAGLIENDLSRIELAVEEAVINIMNYSFPEKDGEISMNCELSNNSIIIEISDNGIPFDPLAQIDPDITLPIEERDVGGLGIFLIKNIMSDVTYQRKNDCNVLTLTKELNS